MSDPYKILGVSPNATDDEVKAAYRELARKYPPDSYAGNPLSDLAAEKMKEINEAYDQVMTRRRDGQGRGQGTSRPSSGSSQFWDIRRLINAGRISEAEELLDGVPREGRDAEWYFLKGSIQYTRGWMEDAYENFARACEMNPNNREYQAALGQLQWQRQNGRAQGAQRQAPVGGCSVCDVCATMYCASCCCDACRCCG